MNKSPSERETLLLNAALNPGADVAAASWRRWASQIALEDAPTAESRLLPAAYAHLRQIAPWLALPKKLQGLAKANFSATQRLALGSLPILEALRRHSPVMLIKGLAMCIRFNSWASRPMLDVDLHVPRSALDGALKILMQEGWTPHYGMSWASLAHRTAARRDSWNFSKGHSQIDLHWRLASGGTDGRLDRRMWQSGQLLEYSGREMLVQSPEFAFITTLQHGFLMGLHSDALQSIVDAAWLLSCCDEAELTRLIREAGLVDQIRELLSCWRMVGISPRDTLLMKLDEMPRVRTEANATRRRSQPSPAKESTLLRRPILYRAWNAVGRRSRLERLLLDWTGPFSRPLKPQPPREEYDLRDCDVIDEIAGPGWSWPEPDRSCFWTDRADARLLIPLREIDDHLLILTFAERPSPNASIDIFANGLYVTNTNLSERLGNTACCLMVTRRMLFGPWVELSLRPKPYAGDIREHVSMLGAPARRLRVLDLRHMTEVFGGHEVPQLYLRLLRNEEPYASKFARIEAKIGSSGYKTAKEIPADFDPLLYVLSYPDLFEHEVDAYEHFLMFGRHEKRLWR